VTVWLYLNSGFYTFKLKLYHLSHTSSPCLLWLFCR
jgi:hypothetical protein